VRPATALRTIGAAPAIKRWSFIPQREVPDLTRLADRFSVCLWTLGGLLIGTPWGVFQLREPRVVADVHRRAGIEYSGPLVRAGRLPGIVSGTTAGLLGQWLRVS